MTTLKSNLTVSSKTENKCALSDSNLFLMTYPGENSHTCAQEDRYKDLHCKLFKSEKFKTTQH